MDQSLVMTSFAVCVCVGAARSNADKGWGGEPKQVPGGAKSKPPGVSICSHETHQPNASPPGAKSKPLPTAMTPSLTPADDRAEEPVSDGGRIIDTAGLS